jgi:hypothetical protein
MSRKLNFKLYYKCKIFNNINIQNTLIYVYIIILRLVLNAKYLLKYIYLINMRK